MVKRERQSSPVSDDSNSTLIAYDPISADERKPNIKKKKNEGSPGKNGKGGSSKVPWSNEEDTALITILEEVIKTQLWPAIKSSGNQQLISRGSYGSQYHAKVLLKQGKTVTKK